MKTYKKLFDAIIAPENLFAAWDRFKQGKRGKLDVQEFERYLEQNIFKLYRELRDRTYKHDVYTSFYIQDPKQRHIHKASVRDRIVHHAVFRIINPLFEPTFISHSFSCRVGKGTHKGVAAMEKMIRQVSRNYSGKCFVLKCDIRSFFESIDHDTLVMILRKKVRDEGALWLIEEIIKSHYSKRLSLFNLKGLPIGNLTSQLFANIYLNEFDQFVKQKLAIKHYARYTDDFVIVSESEEQLRQLIPPIRVFLQEKLSLDLHPGKVSIAKIHRGIDFLGFVSFPHHRLLRTKTKWRMFRKLRNRVREYNEGKIEEEKLGQVLQSYLGVLSHANTEQLRQKLLNTYWFWRRGG